MPTTLGHLRTDKETVREMRRDERGGGGGRERGGGG